MKKRYNWLILMILVVSISPNSFSQQIPDSLLSYMEMAALNNPAVLQKFTEYEIALKKIPQVGSLPDPQLDIGVFITPMELVGGNQFADLRLMQMFPWFGALKNAKDEMSLMAKARYELFRDAKLQVYYDVQRTWYELFKVRKEISVSEKSIEILGVIERLALTSYRSAVAGGSGTEGLQSGMQAPTASVGSSAGTSGMQGMGGSQTPAQSLSPGQSGGSMQPGSMSSSSPGSGLTDIYRIQIEAGDLRNDIANLRNQEQTVIARFNSYLNRPPLSYVYTGDTLVPDTLELDLSAVTDSIRENNPMLNMLAYEKDAYQSRRKMVSAMGYPMVGVGLSYSVIGKSEMSASSMNGNDMIMPMLSVTLPIYRKKYAAMREEADLLSRASSENYQAASNSLNADYYAALQLYQDAGRRLKLYQDQYSLASRSLQIMLKSFSSSAVSLTDVLRVRQQTLDYELRQVEAITDLNTARAWLARLMATYEN